MRLLFAAAIAVTSSTVAIAQNSPSEAAKQAISMVQKLCVSPTAFKIEVGGDGEISLKNFSAKLLSSIKFNSSDIAGYVDGISGVIASEQNNSIRDCQLRTFPIVFTALTPPPSGKRLLIMDSNLRAYRQQLKDSGGTNADDITSALDVVRVGTPALPIVTIKETTGTQWDRLSQVLSQKPDGILIHFSAFEARDKPCAPLNGKEYEDCNNRFFEVAREIVRSGIPLMIYTRTANICNYTKFFRSKLSDVILQQKRGLVALIDMSGEGMNFTNSTARAAIRDVTRRIVGQDSTNPEGSRYCTLGGA